MKKNSLVIGLCMVLLGTFSYAVNPLSANKIQHYKGKIIKNEGRIFKARDRAKREMLTVQNERQKIKFEGAGGNLVSLNSQIRTLVQRTPHSLLNPTPQELNKIQHYKGKIIKNEGRIFKARDRAKREMLTVQNERQKTKFEEAGGDLARLNEQLLDLTRTSQLHEDVTSFHLPSSHLPSYTEIISSPPLYQQPPPYRQRTTTQPPPYSR